VVATIAGVVYCLGNVLYLMGYADTAVDVDKARHAKGGPLKMLGMLLSLRGWLLFVVPTSSHSNDTLSL
jgi:hypothetical protein